MARVIQLQIPYVQPLAAETARERQYKRWMKFMQLQSGLLFLQPF